MDNPDLAKIACVVAAIGAALLLAGRGRALVVGGLALAGLAGAGLVGSAAGIGRVDALASAPGVAAALLGMVALCAAAGAFGRWPAAVPLAVLVCAPLRPPITLGDGDGVPIGLADDGELGRLLPLYFVLGAAALALAWRAFGERDEPALATRPLPPVVALPAAAFVGFTCVSLLWADPMRPGVETLVFFVLPFAVLLAVVARAPFPPWLPRALGVTAIAMAAVFAAIGLFQEATRELFFFAPNLQASNANSDYFRVTSLFGDPSLYGRHLVLGIAVLLSLMALLRIELRLAAAALTLLWAGLFFSYSQSSMIALVVVTLAVAALTGTRRVRRTVVGVFALALLVGIGYVVSIPLRGESLRTETADRSQRVEDSLRVIESEPVVGVGVGAQADASRGLSDSARPTATFVSHTAPLTVTAELGFAGLALFAWLLYGAARMLLAVRRAAPALGLALLAAFLALFTQSLFYPGFLDDPLTWVIVGVGAGYLTWHSRDGDGGDAAAATATAAATEARA